MVKSWTPWLGTLSIFGLSGLIYGFVPYPYHYAIGAISVIVSIILISIVESSKKKKKKKHKKH